MRLPRLHRRPVRSGELLIVVCRGCCLDDMGCLRLGHMQLGPVNTLLQVRRG